MFNERDASAQCMIKFPQRFGLAGSASACRFGSATTIAEACFTNQLPEITGDFLAIFLL
jgi:hypothetical protein